MSRDCYCKSYRPDRPSRHAARKRPAAPKPPSSIRVMRMFGASAGSRFGSAGHFIVESCSRGLAALSLIDAGENGDVLGYNSRCRQGEAEFHLVWSC